MLPDVVVFLGLWLNDDLSVCLGQIRSKIVEREVERDRVILEWAGLLKGHANLTQRWREKAWGLHRA